MSRMSELSVMLMQYEEGDMSEDQIAELFQYLIDTGMVRQLQGHYGRMARHLIETGQCVPPQKEE